MFKRLKTACVPTGELNITSLVDVMVLLTIYLLMAASTSAFETKRAKDIDVPATKKTETLTPAIRIALSETAMHVDNIPVASLSAGQFQPGDLDGLEHIVPLFYALAHERLQKLTALASERDIAWERQALGLVYIEAAKGLPYGTIDRVLRTAAAAGFNKFRFVVNDKG